MFKFANSPAVGLLKRSTRAVRAPSNFGLIRDLKGFSAVEFALVLPVFMMMILGILEMGRALKTWNEVNHALTRAVRLVNLDSKTTPAEIATAMHSYLGDINTSELSIVATPTTITGTDYIKISVGFPFQISLPFTEIAALNINVDTIAPILSSTK
jgi:Flp pilus assembly protein TadG